MNTTFDKLWLKFRSKAFRQTFVESEVKRGIPFQMRALLKKQQLSQKELAKLSGLTQGAISRALNPNYGNLTLNTIIRIAAGLDVAFVGAFVPFSRLIENHESLSEELSGAVETFEEEDMRNDGQDGAETPARIYAQETQVDALMHLVANGQNQGTMPRQPELNFSQPLAMAARGESINAAEPPKQQRTERYGPSEDDANQQRSNYKRSA